MKDKYQLRHQKKDLSFSRNLFLMFLTVFLVMILLGSWLIRYWQRDGRPNINDYPVLGVSLSQEDGYQDFRLLKKHGIDFVYLKATQGADYFDDAFNTNYFLLQGAQIPFGVYHYFSFSTTPQQQFVNFKTNVQQNIGTLPIVIQVNNYQETLPKPATVKKSVSQLSDLLLKYYQRPVLIEADPQFNYLKDVTNNSLWLQQRPHPTNNLVVTFWQYSSHSKIPSLASDNRYHLSVFNGTQEQWDHFRQTGGN
ncbi:GH25 family lysozyme [Bombilactobacillus thymidiniphilus]|uniref:Lysozyme n=1 Tax=Bombilactobacillus thymidiniphilus TaxID=2923363 RepID=A0ABY4PCF5_9LACO|nr:GH25 family lysozyme [Bombilactobacillus thymidiniphilus]UQS83244.1 lysozyme [Bombilactobacillus thymidiniphilus]